MFRTGPATSTNPAIQAADVRYPGPAGELLGYLARPSRSGQFPGIVIIYLKACLLAALTLFVSTFATTNIFTIVVMVFVYFIGHLQATAREYWLQEHGSGLVTRVFLAVVALLFPDLQAFNLVDDIVAGTAISLGLFLKTAALGIFYTTIYTLLAAFVFYGKEL